MLNCVCAAVLSAMAAAQVPSADAVGYQVRVYEMTGLEWRAALQGELRALDRQGGATVWLAPKSAASKIEGASGATVFAPKPANGRELRADVRTTRRRAYVASVERVADGPVGHATKLAFKPEIAWVDESLSVAVECATADSGASVALAIDETRLASMCTYKITDCVEPPPGKAASKDYSVDVSINVPELITSEVQGEYRVPNDHVLIVGLGVHSMQRGEGERVLTERVAVIDPDDVTSSAPSPSGVKQAVLIAPDRPSPVVAPEPIAIAGQWGGNVPLPASVVSPAMQGNGATVIVASPGGQVVIVVPGPAPLDPNVRPTAAPVYVPPLAAVTPVAAPVVIGPAPAPAVAAMPMPAVPSRALPTPVNSMGEVVKLPPLPELPPIPPSDKPQGTPQTPHALPKPSQATPSQSEETPTPSAEPRQEPVELSLNEAVALAIQHHGEVEFTTTGLAITHAAHDATRAHGGTRGPNPLAQEVVESYWRFMAADTAWRAATMKQLACAKLLEKVKHDEISSRREFGLRVTADRDVVEAEEMHERCLLDTMTAKHARARAEKSLGHLVGVATGGRPITLTTAPSRQRFACKSDACVARTTHASAPKPAADAEVRRVSAREASIVEPCGVLSWLAAMLDISTPMVTRSLCFDGIQTDEAACCTVACDATIDTVVMAHAEAQRAFDLLEQAQKIRASAHTRLEAQRAFFAEGTLTIDRYFDAINRYYSALAQEAECVERYNVALAQHADCEGKLLASMGVFVGSMEPGKLADKSKAPTDSAVLPAKHTQASEKPSEAHGRVTLGVASGAQSIRVSPTHVRLPIAPFCMIEVEIEKEIPPKK